MHARISQGVKVVKLSWLTFVLLLVIGVIQMTQGAYILAKAQLAQWLIKDAWHESLLNKNNNKPWSWADTWPVARLTVGSEQLYVLQGASLRVLAFGPGYLNQSALPGKDGNTVILGHRDTHFASLQYLEPGDSIGLQYINGERNYTVRRVDVAHKDAVANLQIDGRRTLTLITCYPFDAVTPETPWRYVVIAAAA